MASINEVYGQNYHKTAFQARNDHIIDIVASNLANLNFQLRHNFAPLFNQGQIADCDIKKIIKKIELINSNLVVLPIQKHEMNMVPYTLSIPAAYFRIIDLDRKKLYLVYISTENMEPY